PHVRPLSTPSTSSFFVTTDTPRIRLPTSFPTRRSSDLFPHRMEGEGHFLALLRKSGDGKQREMLSGAARNPEIKENRKKSGKQEKQNLQAAQQKRNRGRKESDAGKDTLESAREFLSHTRRDWNAGKFFCRQDQIYYLSSGMEPAEGIRYLRSGLWIGTVKKGRFEPSQALAMALTPETFDVVLDLPAEEDRKSTRLNSSHV